jgi:hypothetical protein
MHGNQLIFSRSGSRSRLYGVSPLLFPQYTVLNGFFLPDPHELPAHGLTTRFLPFDFGFNDPTLIVQPYDTSFFQIVMGENFLAEAITGVNDVPNFPPTPGAQQNVNVDPSYLINFQHTHQGTTRQWMNKNVTNGEAVGTGENPLLFKIPALVLQGDTLTCQVQNMANASMRIMVTLIGGAF